MKKSSQEQYVLLQQMLVESRESAGLAQQDVAAKLGKHQTFVSKVENGQRRLDLIEFLQMADVLEFDPHDFIKKLRKRSSHK
jgi:transcriptional regulator with XRE-family HTH domain